MSVVPAGLSPSVPRSRSLAAPKLPRKRIVLAEDDDEMRTMLASALRRDGHEVLEAASGSELLESLGSCILHLQSDGLIDLIVSDIHMPAPNGLELLAALRRAQFDAPFLLITAFGDDQTHATAQKLGASILDKPFDLDDFRQAVIDCESEARAR